jgi:hypothetical protein
MFSVITNIYNKKTKGPTLMELFTATRKLKKFFWQLEMFDVCTTGDINRMLKFLPHSVNMGASILFTAAVTLGQHGHVEMVGRTSALR